MKSIAIFVTTTESEKLVIRWGGCCGNPLITDCGPDGRNNNLNSEHWHEVIRRDRVSISLLHRSDNFLDFRHWPGLPEVVKMVTSSTAGDGSFVAATTFSFRHIGWLIYYFQ